MRPRRASPRLLTPSPTRRHWPDNRPSTRKSGPAGLCATATATSGSALQPERPTRAEPLIDAPRLLSSFGSNSAPRRRTHSGPWSPLRALVSARRAGEHLAGSPVCASFRSSTGRAAAQKRSARGTARCGPDPEGLWQRESCNPGCGVQSLDGLAGDLGDEIEVLVVVEHDKAGTLSGRGDDQVW
jgi:hypothetical protein